MKVIVCGVRDVAEIQEKENVTKILSLLDFSPRPFYSNKRNAVKTYIHCGDHEQFHDAATPTTDTVKQILKFSASLHDSDTIIVHCMAGISRSCAAAMIIAWDHMRDIGAVEKFIRAVRPIAAPNRLLCELADEWFNNTRYELYNLADKLCRERYYARLMKDKRN